MKILVCKAYVIPLVINMPPVPISISEVPVYSVLAKILG